MHDPDGLFAHGLPIALTGYYAAEVLGFFLCRFDLLAITRFVLQS
jgi:hypothetical protein